MRQRPLCMDTVPSRHSFWRAATGEAWGGKTYRAILRGGGGGDVLCHGAPRPQPVLEGSESEIGLVCARVPLRKWQGVNNGGEIVSQVGGGPKLFLGRGLWHVFTPSLFFADSFLAQVGFPLITCNGISRLSDSMALGEAVRRDICSARKTHICGMTRGRPSHAGAI